MPGSVHDLAHRLLRAHDEAATATTDDRARADDAAAQAAWDALVDAAVAGDPDLAPARDLTAARDVAGRAGTFAVALKTRTGGVATATVGRFGNAPGAGPSAWVVTSGLAGPGPPAGVVAAPTPEPDAETAADVVRGVLRVLARAERGLAGLPTPGSDVGPGFDVHGAPIPDLYP